MPVVGAKLPIVPAKESYEWLRLLFYGDSGVGKTVLSASACLVPEMYPVLLVDFPPGDGTLSVSDMDLDVLHMTSTAQLAQVERLIKRQVAAEDPRKRYMTLILDDLDMLYMLNLRERLKKEQSKPGRDPYVPWMEDWLHGTFRLRGIIARFKALPIHLICTTLAITTKDEQTGVLHRWPLLPGKMTWEVGRYYDLVGHLTVKASPTGKTLDRYLQVQPFALTAGKDRIPGGLLGSRVLNPSVQMIYNAAFKGLAPGEEEGGEPKEEVLEIPSEAIPQQED